MKMFILGQYDPYAQNQDQYAPAPTYQPMITEPRPQTFLGMFGADMAAQPDAFDERAPVRDVFGQTVSTYRTSSLYKK